MFVCFSPGFYTQLYDLCTEYQDKSTFKVVVGPQPFVYIYHPETAEVRRLG